jgi:sulfur carrier protein ThiS
MIDVTVNVSGSLRRFMPEGAAQVRLEVAEGTSAHHVINMLGAQDEVWVIAINSVVVKATETIKAGDSIHFFAPLQGG